MGPQDEEIVVDEWRSAFPNDPDDGTSPDPARGTPYMTRKDLLDLYFDRKLFSLVKIYVLCSVMQNYLCLCLHACYFRLNLL